MFKLSVFSFLKKRDISAKLNQSIKQLERKQSEMDEVQGRLKASRERVEELEKHTSKFYIKYTKT